MKTSKLTVQTTLGLLSITTYAANKMHIPTGRYRNALMNSIRSALQYDIEHGKIADSSPLTEEQANHLLYTRALTWVSRSGATSKYGEAIKDAFAADVSRPNEIIIEQSTTAGIVAHGLVGAVRVLISPNDEIEILKSACKQNIAEIERLKIQLQAVEAERDQAQITARHEAAMRKQAEAKRRNNLIRLKRSRTQISRLQKEVHDKDMIIMARYSKITD